MNSNKKESSGDLIVKLVIFLGAIAAIFVAATMIYRKCAKKLNCLNDEDAFDFDDTDFIDECDLCDADDCSDCCLAKDEAVEADAEADSDAEEA